MISMYLVPSGVSIGIDQDLWKPRPDIDDLEVLMVDCAGQRGHLLTHQFFFSQGISFSFHKVYFIIVILLNIKHCNEADSHLLYVMFMPDI